jgi:DNA repair protein RadC
LEVSTTSKKAYQLHLFDRLPLYTTRLVREADFSFSDRTQVCAPADVAAFLRRYFADKDREEFLTVSLDTANTIIGMAQISIGGLSASIVEPRAVFRAAILSNAAAVILAHQHPSGNLEPSREDVKITRQLAEAGQVMGIPVHDHLIIAEHGYTSLAERGVIDA